ncbi:hypothetical protein HUJ05_000517 [Dendroctonus ponderosae]|nr:hypothetical protein HUJ05_000517 [Dendroctonus ponderosae]
MADDSWRAHSFRQNIIAKIDEAIRQSGMNTSKNSLEMENHVFQKAKNREEYLSFVARLILHVREMNKKPGQLSGVPGGQQQQAPGMPDPINALQNLASQGSRNSMVGMGGPPQANQMRGPGQGNANLLQPINQPQIMMGGGMPGNMGLQVPRVQNMNMPPNAQMPGQMPMQIPNPMGGQMGGQMGGGMQNRFEQLCFADAGRCSGSRPNGFRWDANGARRNAGTHERIRYGQVCDFGSMQQQMQQQKPPNSQNSMLLNPNMMGGGGYVRQSGPGQIFAQSPLQPSAQSPAGGNLSQPSSASPALASSSVCSLGMGIMGGPPRAQCLAPSPVGSINTPGQPSQSPMAVDEQAYRDKIRQLSIYIDPLRRVIARTNDRADSNDGGEKMMSKMKKLLEILTNPHQRMPLETLIKCEIVLEKIDFKSRDAQFKDLPAFHSLLDVVAQNLQSPVINHTLHRTFGPTLDALFGPEFKLVPPLKRAKLEEPTSDIPDVLQGEIARLDQRFKVSLDPNQQPGAKSIQLICWLDCKQLPCVPPISLTIPENYPKKSPTCHIASHEYNATTFLSDVQTALLARITKLPKNYSVSHLLDTWEMSVRQASAPNKSISSNSLTTLMGF